MKENWTPQSWKNKETANNSLNIQFTAQEEKRP